MQTQQQERAANAVRRTERRGPLIAAATLMASTTAAVVAHARLRNWGATAEEAVRQLPGDELIFDAVLAMTRRMLLGIRSRSESAHDQRLRRHPGTPTSA